MVRSLLDGADLPALRALNGQGPAAAIAAAVVDSGLLHFDADDPQWEDRDRVVVCGPALHAALAQRLGAAGADPQRVLITADDGGTALALAFGAALSSAMDGGAWRSWCLLDEAACDDGRTWEVAAAVRDAGAEPLGAIVLGDRTAALWRACGWKVQPALVSEPVELLGGLDQVLVAGPAVLVAVDA